MLQGEARVATAYGGFTGASANGVLRSGTNRVAGLGEYWFTRPNWVENNTPARIVPRRIETLWDASAQVGGPVVHDRFWYFAGLEYYRLVLAFLAEGIGSGRMPHAWRNRGLRPDPVPTTS